MTSYSVHVIPNSLMQQTKDELISEYRGVLKRCAEDHGDIFTIKYNGLIKDIQGTSNPIELVQLLKRGITLQSDHDIVNEGNKQSFIKSGKKDKESTQKALQKALNEKEELTMELLQRT
jgi:hypothetical protein